MAREALMQVIVAAEGGKRLIAFRKGCPEYGHAVYSLRGGKWHLRLYSRDTVDDPWRIDNDLVVFTLFDVMRDDWVVEEFE